MMFDDIPLDVWFKISGFVGVLVVTIVGAVLAIQRNLFKMQSNLEEQIAQHSAATNERLTKIDAQVFPYHEQITSLKEKITIMVEKIAKQEANAEHHATRLDQHQRQIENIQQQSRG